ncbi:unnamed protein product, partial [Discosporangium mesarthrocarpum]
QGFWPEQQCGFRRRRSTIEHGVRDAKYPGTRSRKPYTTLHHVCVCFIDEQKRYGSADRELLWTVLARFEVPTRYEANAIG